MTMFHTYASIKPDEDHPHRHVPVLTIGGATFWLDGDPDLSAEEAAAIAGNRARMCGAA